MCRKLRRTLGVSSPCKSSVLLISCTRVILTCAMSAAAGTRHECCRKSLPRPGSRRVFYFPSCVTPQGLELHPSSLCKSILHPSREQTFSPVIPMIHADTCREAGPQRLFASSPGHIRIAAGACRLPAASLLPGAHLEMFQPHCRPELEVVAQCTAHLFPWGWLRTHRQAGRQARTHARTHAGQTPMDAEAD